MSVISLGQRLTKLKDSIGPDYQHIWDCCCDHGQLGISLVQNQTAPHIHFVDCVPQIIEELEIKLARQFSDKNTGWKTHCLDASKLKISEDKSKHLVIIAGIGGDLTLQMINAIHTSNPSANIDFLLCPIRQLYKLRSALNTLQFQVKLESLVEENKRIYEVIMISPSSSSNVENEAPFAIISKTGDMIWQTNKELAKKYFLEINTHYQKMLNTGNPKIRTILKEYQDAAKAAL